eukprot:CAMPEP_0197589968 /NCGR_PEP_ID=MMETSP1326-20131121/10723_1 /TAXON_ID=1155430 /ORGANISM="Genus nov. species nov., Strain RCC2288" /LENGTH=205 /DNA_ID=CAMNT_0043154953 /DNA_START=53 /DNA_END=667 /DNA_ORIENTATION=-
MDSHPLVEFVHRSATRGQCDAATGVATGFPIPWAFTLATAGQSPDLPPSIRNIGFHSVDATGFLFTTRGGPGGSAGPGENASGAPMVASLCYLTGNYPKAGFEEQWRAEGIVEEVDMAALTAVAPPDADLQVQIVASAAFATAREATTGSVAPVDGDGRLVLQGSVDDKALDIVVTLTAAKQKKGELEPAECAQAGFRAYRLVPW